MALEQAHDSLAQRVHALLFFGGHYSGKGITKGSRHAARVQAWIALDGAHLANVAMHGVAVIREE